MINLNPITDDCIKFFYKIVKSKNEPFQGRLARIRPAVKQRMSLYLNHLNSLEVIPIAQYTVLTKGALIHSYTGETQTLLSLKNKIKANQSLYGRSHCQFCTIGVPSTFDHYLEKENFPEYSSFGLNLIPCCFECNNKKKAVIENGSRNYINFYYDNIPQTQFLFCEVVSVDGEIPVLRYWVENRNNVSPYTFTIIEKHFNKLDLELRFIERINENVYATISELRRIANPSRQVIIGALNEEFQKRQREYGINNYKVVLYQALMNSEDFLSLF